MSADGTRRLDEELKKKITKNIKIRRKLLDKLHPRELLQYMPCVYIGTKEAILQEDRNYGKRRATAKFLDDVHAYSGWGEEFLRALCNTGHETLANELYPGYQLPSDDDHVNDEGSNSGGGGSIGSHSNNFSSSRQPRNDHGSSDQKDYPPPYTEATTETMPKDLIGRRVYHEDQMTKRRVCNTRIDESENDYGNNELGTHRSRGYKPVAHSSNCRQTMPSAAHDVNILPRAASLELNHPHQVYDSHAGDNCMNAQDQRQSSASSFNLMSHSLKSGACAESFLKEFEVQQSESNSMDKVLREYQTNDLSSTQTSNDSQLSSYNETTSCNNPAQAILSSDTVAECKNYNREQPDLSVLKEQQTSIQHSDYSYFRTTSLPFSTEISKEVTSNDIKHSEDEDDAPVKESDHPTPHSPVLISDINQDENLINLRSDAEIKHPGETSTAIQASSGNELTDPFSSCNSSNETNTSETESYQHTVTGSKGKSVNAESMPSSSASQHEINLSSSSQSTISQHPENPPDNCDDLINEFQSEENQDEVQSTPAPNRLNLWTSLGNIVSSLPQLHNKYSHYFTENQLKQLDEDLENKVLDPDITTELMENIEPTKVLRYMPCVDKFLKQEIQSLDKKSQLEAAARLLDQIPGMYSNWAVQFLDALHRTGLRSLAVKLSPNFQPLLDGNHANDGGSNNGGANGGSRNNFSSGPSGNDDCPFHRKDYPPSYAEATGETIAKTPLGSTDIYGNSSRRPPVNPGVLKQAVPTTPMRSSGSVAVPPAAHDVNVLSRTAYPQQKSNFCAGDYNRNVLDQMHSSIGRFDLRPHYLKSGAGKKGSLQNLGEVQQYQANDLSFTQTSNDSRLSSYNETTSYNNPAQAISSETVAEHKNYNSEQPDPSVLKEQQTSIQLSDCSYFQTTSLPFSTEISNELTSNDIRCSEDKDDAPVKESDHPTPHSPVLISDINQDENLINLRSDAEIKHPGETSTAIQASSGNELTDPFSVCNSSNETNTSETESYQHIL